MKYTLATLAFGIGASARVLQRDDCSFTLTASGGLTGNVGQLDDGQNRIGGNPPTSQATYSINNGQITSAGKGCILTPPTTQFQCDAGATPTGGFSIGSNGALSHDGSTTFYACPATDSEYNIYTTPVENQPKCVEVGLTASGCYGNGQPASSKPATSAAPPAQTQTAPPQTQTQTAPAPPPQTETKTAPPETVTDEETKTQTAPPQTVTKEQTETATATAPPQTITQQTTLPAETVQVTQTVQSSCPAPSTVTETSVVVSTVQASCPAPSTVTVTSIETAPAPAPVTETAPVAVPVPTTQTQVISSIATATAPVVTETQTTQAGQPSVPATQPAGQPSAPATQPQPTQGQATSPAAPAGTAPAASPSSCPANLNGNYQYPHLIVPVDSASPDKAAGTQYNGKVTSTISSIFNFDIPASYTGTCSLVFLFPEQKDLETSSFTFSGNGVVDFKQLTTVASQSTTFANQGESKDLGTQTVTPGTSTVVSTFPCPAGQAVSYEISAVSGTDLEFFQDYNPSPIGLYVTTC
ncbi:hypothetical protein GLAREA_05135 [Glarea lozoyensis ATCC 20868]|uniref:Uncharacterized protein n=1 Tax=Glarea lozoyensis (strain ATCC 20868 / MF5171) TaxID=1116229 RepID=S3DBJ7_GLAL2|nr:uncharacterized protein GLAREA_05135 [Glarea lozoyensis ATCC 20868]EPE35797.1 hypothetical protein GLAREA_05135 [Glarea lozoyensis ATCC 20868]